MNSNNFFIQSKANWKGCARPARKPDYISRNKFGEISSEYWYSEKGVIRCSQHWSHVYSSVPQRWTEHTADIEHSSSSCRIKRRYYIYELEYIETELVECVRVSNCYWTLKINREDQNCGFCPWTNFRKNKLS